MAVLIFVKRKQASLCAEYGLETNLTMWRSGVPRMDTKEAIRTSIQEVFGDAPEDIRRSAENALIQRLKHPTCVDIPWLRSAEAAYRRIIDGANKTGPSP